MLSALLRRVSDCFPRTWNIKKVFSLTAALAILCTLYPVRFFIGEAFSDTMTVRNVLYVHETYWPNTTPALAPTITTATDVSLFYDIINNSETRSFTGDLFYTNYNDETEIFTDELPVCKFIVADRNQDHTLLNFDIDGFDCAITFGRITSVDPEWPGDIPPDTGLYIRLSNFSYITQSGEVTPHRNRINSKGALIPGDFLAVDVDARSYVFVNDSYISSHIFYDIGSGVSTANDQVQGMGEPDADGITVTATEETLGYTYTTTTDSSGNYELLVIPGTYTISITEPDGYSVTTTNPIPLVPAAANGGTIISSSALYFTDSLSYDLSLEKIVDEPAPTIGDEINYLVTLTNNGPNTATGVVVTDLLPEGLTDATAITSTGSYNIVNGEWLIDSLGSGSGATLSITATVTGTNPITNRAEVTLTYQTDPDSTPDNCDIDLEDDCSEVTIFPQEAAPSESFSYDLSLEKIVDNATPTVGDEINYLVTLTNNGPDTATGVIVTDILPASLTDATALTSTGTYNIVNGEWLIDSLDSSSTATLAITATVTGTNPITNRAEVTLTYQTDPDSTPDNCDIDLEDDCSEVTVTPQEAQEGSTGSGSVSGKVFYDNTSDHSGIQSGDEPGISQVLVTLYNSSDEIIDTFITDSTGIYTFTNVEVGNYYIQISNTPTNYVFSTQHSGEDTDIDSNSNESGQTDLFGIEDGSEVVHMDAGTYLATSTISGRYFIDNNRDGIQDEDDTEGIIADINAYHVGSETSIASATSSTDGSYTLTDIPAQLCITANTHWHTSDTITYTCENTAVDGAHTITFTTDSSCLGDETALRLEDDSGTLWEENCGPGGTLAPSTQYDVTVTVGSAGTATLTLTDNGNNGGIENLTWSYSNIQVQFGLPAGTYEFSPRLAGDSNIDSEPFPSGETENFSILPDQHITNFDAGIFARLPQISGQVFDDENSNGLFDATESGLEGVTVEIYAEEDTLVDTIVTDTSGEYESEEIPEGNYYVHFVLPENYAYSPYQIESESLENSDAQVTNGNSTIFTLDAFGETINAGMYEETPALSADLSVTGETLTTTPILFNSTVSYQFTVSNSGPDTASGITILHTFPTELTSVSGTASRGSYDADTGLWDVGALKMDESAILEISGNINTIAALVQTVEIISSSEADPDSTPNNQVVTEDDMVSITTTPIIPSLEITKTSHPSPPRPGEQVMYTITVTNTSNILAENITIQDDLDDTSRNTNIIPTCVLNNTQVTAFNNGQLNTGTNTITWELDSIEGNGTRMVNFLVTIRDDIDQTTTCRNTAIASGINTESVSTNAIMTVPVIVESAAISFNKRAIDNTSEQIYYPGDEVNYQITISNSGTAPLDNIRLEDNLPSSLSNPSGVTIPTGATINTEELSQDNIHVNNISVHDGTTRTINYSTEVTSADDFPLRRYQLDADADRDDDDFYVNRVVESEDDTAENALGTPDQSVVTISSGNSVTFQIGRNRTLSKLVVDGDGDDFCVLEQDYSTDINAYEQYIVEVSQTSRNRDFEQVGRRNSNSNCFDLGDADMTWARYIRITDQSTNGEAGVDIDAVCLLNLGGFVTNTAGLYHGNDLLGTSEERILVDFTEAFDNPLRPRDCRDSNIIDNPQTAELLPAVELPPPPETEFISMPFTSLPSTGPGAIALPIAAIVGWLIKRKW